MPGHRYWRLLLKTSGQADFDFAEAQFRTAAGVPLLFSGGVASAATSYSNSYLPANAADNDLSTSYASDTYGGVQWWQYDYGAGNAPDIVEVAMTSRTDGGIDQTPLTWDVQWSDDGAAWRTRWSCSAAPWSSAGQTQTFTVPAPVVAGPPPGPLPSGAHRFWRAVIHSIDGPGWPDICGIEFRATPGTPAAFPSGCVFTASSTYDSYTPDKAADGSTATSWSANTPVCPAWWECDYGPGQGLALAEVAMTARPDSGQAPETPKTFDMAYSDDGVGLTVVQSYTATPWVPGQTQTFAVPSTASAAPAPSVFIMA